MAAQLTPLMSSHCFATAVEGAVDVKAGNIPKATALLQEAGVDVTELEAPVGVFLLNGGTLRVFKAQLRPAESSLHPIVGCVTEIYYLFRDSNGQVISTSVHAFRDRLIGGIDVPSKLLLLRDEYQAAATLHPDDLLTQLPLPAHMAVASMAGGEIARFMWKEPTVDTPFVVLDVGLVSWGPPLPLVPSPAELRAQEMEEKAKQREQFDAEPRQSLEEKINKAMALRVEGNTALACGDQALAKTLYGRAFGMLFISSEESEYCPELGTDEALVRVSFARCVLYLNRCVANMRLRDFDAGMWDAAEAVKSIGVLEGHSAPYDPALAEIIMSLCGSSDYTNALSCLGAKAHYRKACCSVALAEAELDKETLVPRQYWDEGRVKAWLAGAQADIAIARDAMKDDQGKLLPLSIQM
jgi:hypothetical protein